MSDTPAPITPQPSASDYHKKIRGPAANAQQLRGAHRPIDQIIVGERFRRHLGDLIPLAASMDELGLLQPIVIRPTACLSPVSAACAPPSGLAGRKFPSPSSNWTQIVRGEYAENCFRLNLTLSEAVAIKRALEPIEREAAKERQREGGRIGGKGSGKLPEASKGNAATRPRKRPAWRGAPWRRLRPSLMPPRPSRRSTASCSSTWTASGA